MKSVDIDTLLAESELEIKLKGKTYKIRDISMSSFLTVTKEEAMKDRDLLLKQLAGVLGVKFEQLKKDKVGMRAAGMTLNAVREWIAERTEEEVPMNDEEGKGKPEDPSM